MEELVQSEPCKKCNSVLAKEINEPIRGRRRLKLQGDDERNKITQLPLSCEQTERKHFAKMGQSSSTNALTGTAHSAKFKPKLELAIKICENIIVSSYQDSENLQKIFVVVKNPTKGKIKDPGSPWRERFSSPSLDKNNCLYLDDRLVIPNLLQCPNKIHLHWGHPGRDQMLRQIADIWWPKIHRDIVLLTMTCKKCQEAGKSIKLILRQKQFGKLPTPNKTNEKIAIDFASPFKIANSSIKYLVVSGDSKTGWPDAKFLRAPTTNKVIEFPTNYIANNSIPRQIGTDPGTAFTSKKFKEIFYKTYNLPQNRPQGKWKSREAYQNSNRKTKDQQKNSTTNGNTE